MADPELLLFSFLVAVLILLCVSKGFRTKPRKPFRTLNFGKLLRWGQDTGLPAQLQTFDTRIKYEQFPSEATLFLLNCLTTLMEETPMGARGKTLPRTEQGFRDPLTGVTVA
jgi:hypothetical protein